MGRGFAWIAGVAAAVMLASTGQAGAATGRGHFDPDLGTHWPLHLVFPEKPQRAVPTKGSACEIAEQYVNIVESGGGAKVVALFAPDAEFVGSLNRVMRGREEIAGFYAQVPGLVADAVPISFVDRGNECFMELAVKTVADGEGRYRLAAIDHFTINSQRQIRRLVIFLRPALPSQGAK
jgi:hypothetical protein